MKDLIIQHFSEFAVTCTSMVIEDQIEDSRARVDLIRLQALHQASSFYYSLCEDQPHYAVLGDVVDHYNSMIKDVARCLVTYSEFVRKSKVKPDYIRHEGFAVNLVEDTLVRHLATASPGQSWSTNFRLEDGVLRCYGDKHNSISVMA